MAQTGRSSARPSLLDFLIRCRGTILLEHFDLNLLFPQIEVNVGVPDLFLLPVVLLDLSDSLIEVVVGVPDNFGVINYVFVFGDIF